MPRSQRTLRPGTASQKKSRRELANERTAAARDRSKRQELKDLIRERLRETPAEWKRLYDQKLQEHGLDPRVSIQHVHHLPSLEARKRLLPPLTSYRQHVHSRNPSRPEPRAVSCQRMTGHTKDYVTSACSNAKIIRDPILSFQGSPVRRFHPKNVCRMKTADGGSVCVHPQHVKTMNKSGFLVHSDYQRDSDAKEWPEVRIDVPNEAAGTVLQLRVPYHVASSCGIPLKPVPNRLRHPTHPENAY